MKRFFLSLVVVLSFSNLASCAQAQDDLKSAEVFVTQLGDEIIRIIKDEINTDDQKNAFRRFLNTNFDMKSIARFVLGKYWRRATDAEKETFTELFIENMVDTYSSQFDDYRDEKLSVVDSRQEKDGAIWIKSIASGQSLQPLEIRWKLYNVKGQYRVYDIYVFGASMSITHRSEYAAIIQGSGGKVSSLLDSLRSSNTAS